MNIKKSIAAFQNLLENTNCKLVAVSKTKPDSDILEAFEAGQRIFGENRAQELEEKYGRLPKEIEWHMIGHLQTNKVKYIAPFVGMIQSVDSVKLCKEIDKQAGKNNRIIPVLLQVHIAAEETKFGFDKTELLDLISKGIFEPFHNIQIKGLMAMATLTENTDQIRSEFRELRNLFETIVGLNVFKEFSEVSMGMTSDYKIALEEGSTMIRVGSAIFGERAKIKGN